MKRTLNFRDLGGLPIQDGTVPKGLYMRSGKLSVVGSEQTAELCRKHNIQCIIDLRSPGETEEFPDPVPDGVAYVQIPLLTDATIGITRDTGSDPMTILRKYRNDPAKLRSMMPDMPALYHSMMTDPYSRGQVNKVLDLLQRNAEQGRGTLFHCTAGKDRTGIIAMALLMQMGASEKTILKDYLRTNRAVRWDTLKKCIGIFLLTHNLSFVRFAYRCFMANKEWLQLAMQASPTSS